MASSSAEAWIERHQQRDLLRFLTAGSVDDGKSTLIGRLLFDTQNLFDDQLAALDSTPDLALLTDGLKAEREQGITIDVAWRYFSTDRRKFIICDVPGHEQYTRNMVTGASHCDLAVILVDARHGVTDQTRRHSLVVSLMGIGHVVVAVNKMDLVDYDEDTYRRVCKEFTEFSARLEVSDVHFIPLSAKDGENVVRPSERMPWFEGASLLRYLESVHIASDRNLIDLRFPVQTVLRAEPDFRGYAGTVASGTLRAGDEVAVLPSGLKARVATVRDPAGEADVVFAGQAAVVTLDTDVDVSRGDVLARPANVPLCTQELEVMVVWMGEEPLRPGAAYLLQHGTNLVPATVMSIQYRTRVRTLRRESDVDALEMNEVGRIHLRMLRPLAVDPYTRNRSTGGLIFIDRSSFDTVGAAMIRDVQPLTSPPPPPAVDAAESQVSRDERCRRLGQDPLTIWLTGLPKSGKSTIAVGVERRLLDEGFASLVLDGSTLRSSLAHDLGFRPQDRREHCRRLANVARLANDAGMITIVAMVSPHADDRELARTIVGAERFVLVHCDAPLETCEARDDSGAFAAARAGEIEEFTGISAPFEVPESADLVLDTAGEPAAAGAIRVVDLVRPRIALDPR
ncbi:MAG: adenylyl-sulfate kinase [Planctomycetes bacterium]|nr:adenylyl-sulfate kinase [Planctomycetota bacterium]